MATLGAVEQTFSGLALWLQPAPEQTSQAIDVMERVRKIVAEQQLPAPSAPFSPHATLVAGLDGTAPFASNTVDGVWSQVLFALGGWKEIHPEICQQGTMRIHILRPDTRGTYFQSVVLALQKPKVLVDLHRLARQHLAAGTGGNPSPNLGSTEDYWPHLSLVYADLNEAQAGTVIDRLADDGVWHDGAIYPFPGTSDTHWDHISFASLALWSCQGPPSEWTKLHEVQFADL